MDPHNKVALKEEKEKGRKRKQERKRNEGGHGRASLGRREREKSGKQRKERAREKAKERRGRKRTSAGAVRIRTCRRALRNRVINPCIIRDRRSIYRFIFARFRTMVSALSNFSFSFSGKRKLMPWRSL